MVGSIGRGSSAADNAATGVVLLAAAKERLDRRRRGTRGQLRIAIVTWLERTYHRRRRHGALGRSTPTELEIIMTATASQAA